MYFIYTGRKNCHIYCTVYRNGSMPLTFLFRFPIRNYLLNDRMITIKITKKQFSYMAIQHQHLYSITSYSSVILKDEILLSHTTMGFT